MTYTLMLLLCTIVASQAQYPGHPGAAYHAAPAPQYAAPPAPVGEDGSVVDTPEVAQAKAAHFAEFARAAARAAEDKSQEPGAFGPRFSGVPRPAYAYSGQAVSSTAGAPYSQASYPVASAAVQFQRPAPNPAYHQQQGHYGPEPKRFQVPVGAKAPFVPAPLADDGTVIDTPEVAALKAVRLQELAEAEARAYKYGATDDFPAEGQGQYHSEPQPGPYQAPGPIPRTAYPGPSTYPGSPQSFASAPRSYQSPAPIYQPQAQAYQPQSYQPAQSYQSQY
ncbi:PREDICTED: skin secretory protein xP2-like isoform X2 [Ceratosolen solmsi marchali]|uniref:Skin secretory protein xP2-like isoform X2 n=1 Tax=Ceratosolen solmsi marchali TaxID=326594 RepID=A0AAJ6YD56_9HYME|nr:PREDICTED: skin secretory protein xP2-like isoform X2 [Ceratosolen solmsi marchali]